MPPAPSPAWAIVLEARDVEPCACGSIRVSVFREGLEGLIDNMGCELGPAFVAGPLCPRCEASAVEDARRRAHGTRGGESPPGTTETPSDRVSPQ